MFFAKLKGWTSQEKYDLEFSDGLLSSFQKGLSHSKLSVKELNTLFVENWASSIVILRGYYLRYMYERGFEFYLSGHIWDRMLFYWIENPNNPKTFDAFFRVTIASLEEYLLDFTTGYVSDKPEMIVTLWGSVYIYEFLHKLEIISTDVYQDFLETSQKLKGHIIGMYTPDLWRSNFVHHWQKPDSVSEDEFREEHSIFTKSIYFKHDDFSLTRDYFSEELSKIGPLADYIIVSAAIKASQDFSFFDNLMKYSAESFDDDEYQYYEEKHIEPIRTEPKVGRNEPCPCGSGKKYKKCCGK